MAAWWEFFSAAVLSVQSTWAVCQSACCSATPPSASSSSCALTFPLSLLLRKALAMLFDGSLFFVLLFSCGLDQAERAKTPLHFSTLRKLVDKATIKHYIFNIGSLCEFSMIRHIIGLKRSRQIHFCLFLCSVNPGFTGYSFILFPGITPPD